MKQKRFLFNAATLTITGLAARMIGLWFRIYMSNKIGAQGIGLFQLISSVFYFAVTFATSGITLAVTRLVTDCIAKNQKNQIKHIISICLFVSITLSAACSLLLFVFSDWIGINFLHDARTILSLKVLAPCLPFMAVSACFRGYFYAMRTALKTASEQLLEQVVEIAVFMSIVGLMLPMGLEYACCAIAIGTSLAEVVSFIYSYILYKIDIRKIKGQSKKSPGVVKKLFSIFVPVTLSSTLRSGLSMIENSLIPSGLKQSGASYENSLAGYGMITGMVFPVITFPSAFLSAFSTLMIPEMSEANATTRKNSIKYMTSRILRFSLLFAIPVSVVFFFFADTLGMLIYNEASVGAYIRIFSPIVPLIYLDFVVDGILKGLNQQSHYLLYNIIDSSLRVVLIFILLPIYGIKGLIIVMFVSSVLNTSLSLLRLLKVSELSFKPVDWILKPFIAILLPCITLLVFEHYGFVPAYGEWTILKIAIVSLIFLFIMVITKALSREEVSWLKNIFKLKK